MMLRSSLSAEAIQLAALALRRPAAPGLSHGDTRLSLDDRNGRTVVDHALRRDGCPDSLLDDGHDLKNARTPDERVDAVADLHLRRRLGRRAVHADVPAAAGGRRLRARLVDPDGPEPDVYTRLLDGGIVPASTDTCSR
jgi:hypothetical protein